MKLQSNCTVSELWLQFMENCDLWQRICRPCQRLTWLTSKKFHGKYVSKVHLFEQNWQRNDLLNLLKAHLHQIHPCPPPTCFPPTQRGSLFNSVHQDFQVKFSAFIRMPIYFVWLPPSSHPPAGPCTTDLNKLVGKDQATWASALSTYSPAWKNFQMAPVSLSEPIMEQIRVAEYET